MNCLVVLMIEEEQPEGLSSRKLVVETVKHNVLTAYSAEDGLALLARFPNVDAVLVHRTMLKRMPDIFARVRSIAPQAVTILATPFRDDEHCDARHILNSHNPQELVTLLSQIAPAV